MQKNKKMQNYITDILLGVAVGDAIGVPVEFRSREYLSVRPVVDIIGYGSYNQPPGTWSDDTSLTLALADALCEDFDLQRIADNFVA
jgi:ADP-ribosylglycohydrolase